MLNSVSKLFDEINNKDVFLVAGGPSVNQIDLSYLTNKKIIAVNNSYKLFSDVTMLFWFDSTWADKHNNELDRYPCELRFTCRRNHTVNNLKGAYNVTPLAHTGDFGYDINPDNVRGNNGGTACLNLIINMRPKRIFLLGYDMKKTNGQTHWHNGHTGNPVTSGIYDNLFIPSINSLAEELKRYPNIPEIINFSMNSALSCFKKDDFKNYINEFKAD